MAIEVLAYSDEWPERFARVAGDLRLALRDVPVIDVEHVGSTSVPGLAAKPIIDVDVVVAPAVMRAALVALAAVGYEHVGDLGFEGREALRAPDDDPPRHIYVCVDGSVHLRNHRAVRDVLRARPDLRDEYGVVKTGLAEDPGMDLDRYLIGKTEVLSRVLEAAGFSAEERDRIGALNGA